MAKETLNLEVKSNIKSVTKDSDELGISLGKAVDETTDLNKGLTETGDSGKKGFNAIGTAVKGLGVALKAAGIGVLIAAFVTLKDMLLKNQKVMDTVNTVMTAISVTFSGFVDVLVDSSEEATKNKDKFSALTKVLNGVVTIGLTPLKLSFFAIKLAVQGLQLAFFKLKDAIPGKNETANINRMNREIKQTTKDIKDTGQAAIDAGKDIVENLGPAFKESSMVLGTFFSKLKEMRIANSLALAKSITEAQNAAKLAQADIQGIIEKNDLLAEKQRQIRDDETKTFEQRIQANEKLSAVLKNQEKEMIRLADIRVRAAELELSANKTNIDLQVAYKETLNDRAAVEAQIAGFRSEQLTNQVTLEKELQQVQKDIFNEGLDGMAQELAELKTTYEEKLDMARKAGVDTASITKQNLADIAKIQEAFRLEKEAKDEEARLKQKGLDDVFEAHKQKTIAMGFDAASSLAKEGTEIAKGIAVARTIYNTQQAIMNAMATVPAPFNIAQSIATGVMGAAAIQKILSTNPEAGGGGGGAAATPTPPAPEMMSGAFTLSGGQTIEPTRAYVVSDDITANQNKLAIIRRRATI